MPDDARGTVVFAHGSGSSRFSHRNIAVADVLQVTLEPRMSQTDVRAVSNSTVTVDDRR